MQVKQLENQESIKRLPSGVLIGTPQPFLYCAVCDAEYSADRGDYWAADPETELTCCGEPMIRVKRELVEHDGYDPAITVRRNNRY